MHMGGLKSINIKSRGIEKLLTIDPSVPFEKFIDNVKAMYTISNETNIILFNPDTNSFIVPIMTSQLWDIQQRDIPVYHINESDDNNIDIGGWCKKFLNNYFFNFLMTKNLDNQKKSN
ncbi:hypothetical protein I4U23_027806 [Adineta vaga]|nr:hypothetical protein I4U23_027806 [Adineta vaga]